MVFPAQTTDEKRIHGNARAASWTRIRLKQFSFESVKRRRRGRRNVSIQYSRDR